MQFLRSFLARLWRKLLSVAPLACAAGVILLVMWGLLRLTVPLLPGPWQEVVAQADSGNFPEVRDKLKEALEHAGMPLELAFLQLQVAQIVAAPIPGQVMGLLAGYLFGFWYGLLLSMLGQLLGSWLAVALGRLLGRYFVRLVVPAEWMAKFDALMAKGELWNLFVLMLLPGFPDDALCFLAGLTRIRQWKLVAVIVAGRLPGMAVLAYVGAAADDTWAAYGVFAVAMVVSLIAWLYSDELQAWVLARLRRRRLFAWLESLARERNPG